MPLSSIRNTLDDATHKKLDKRVNKTILEVWGENPFGTFGFVTLLQLIAKCSHGILDPKYQSISAAAVLVRHPELGAMLHAA